MHPIVHFSLNTRVPLFNKIKNQQNAPSVKRHRSYFAAIGIIRRNVKGWGRQERQDEIARWQHVCREVAPGTQPTRDTKERSGFIASG